MIIWLFGRPNSGKTSISNEIKYYIDCIQLDGNDLRSGVSSDLSFNFSDRQENTRRAAEIAKLLHNQKRDVIVSLITPFEESRDVVRLIIPECKLIYLECDLETCKIRDNKGLYSSLDIPFVESNNYDLKINTSKLSVKESVLEILGVVWTGQQQQ